MAMDGGGLAGQVFALAKDLAKVEKDVKALDERDGELKAALAALDLGPLQLAIDHLEERTAGLHDEVQALAPIREALTKLTEQVKQIAEDLQALAADPAEEKLAVWNWSFKDGMDQEQAAEAWGVLVDWVRSELQGSYGWVGWPEDMFAKTSGGYGSVGSGPMTEPRIPPCWYRHRKAVFELGWLCQEWLKIYRTSYGTPSRAGDWHDRYAPNVKRRLTTALSKCIEKGVHVDDPWVTDSSQPGAPLAIDDDEALTHWVSWDLRYRPEPPSAGPVAAS